MLFFALYLLIAMFLTYLSAINATDSMDAWILDKLFVYYILFIIMYSIVVIFSPKLNLVIVCTLIFLLVVNMVPMLKYAFIYGYYDPLTHFGWIRETIKLGSVPQSGIYAKSYGECPGLSIIASIISIIINLDVCGSMKAFLAVSSLIFPLSIYIFIRRLNFPEKLSKAIMVSMTITTPPFYAYFGAISILPIFSFFFFFLILAIVQEKNSFQDFILCTIFGFATLFSHDATSFYLIIVVTLLVLVLTLSRLLGSKIRVPLLLLSFWLIIYITHFIYQSFFNFSLILKTAKSMISYLFLTSEPYIIKYYEYSITHLSIFDKLVIFFLRYGRDAIALSLSFLALILLKTLKLKNEKIKQVYYILSLLLFFNIFGFVGAIYTGSIMSSFLYYSSIMTPILSGMVIYRLISKRTAAASHLVLTSITVIILIGMISLSNYRCQPIMPRLSEEYSSKPVLNIHEVNTIYARSLIKFLENYNERLSIATDSITKYQIYGLTEPSYDALVNEDIVTAENITSPIAAFSPNPRATSISPGRYAFFYETTFQKFLHKENLVYNNGGSYILFIKTTGI